ncbi:hypothetical protein TNCV_4941411 [Trichonephila clavipes]|nr:hypothetical protein TNCV_4941411 [Trichonephila clavipes]
MSFLQLKKQQPNPSRQCFCKRDSRERCPTQQRRLPTPVIAQCNMSKWMAETSRQIESLSTSNVDTDERNASDIK